MRNSDWEHRLDHIEDDLNAIQDSIGTQRQWWYKWGIPAAVVTLIASLMVVFITSYIGLQNERYNLNRQVDTLQGQVLQLNAMKELVSQYSALTAYALQRNRLSQQEVSQFVKGAPGLTPELTPSGPPRTVYITDPSDRSKIISGSIVRGIINNYKINGATIVPSTCWTEGCSKGLSPSERTIWIVTQNTATNRFSPQGSWSTHAGPVLFNATDAWTSPAIFMGATSRGEPILVHAVLVSHSDEDVFKAYLKNCEATGRFPGLERTELPARMKILDTIMVFRK